MKAEALALLGAFGVLHLGCGPQPKTAGAYGHLVGFTGAATEKKALADVQVCAVDRAAGVTPPDSGLVPLTCSRSTSVGDYVLELPEGVFRLRVADVDDSCDLRIAAGVRVRRDFNAVEWQGECPH